jgi:uncharacterized protein (TIGR03435 family)
VQRIAQFVCLFLVCGFAIGHQSFAAVAQAPAATSAPPLENLRFEAVSIRPNTGSSGSMSTRNLPNGTHISVNGSIRNLLSAAYSGTTVEASSLPGWIATERFDITATSPLQGTATTEQRQAMMRALLVERLNFKGHVETREAPAFDLVLARKDGRLGPNMKPASADCEAREKAQRAALQNGASPLPSAPAPGAFTGPVAECTGRTAGNLVEGDFTLQSLLFVIRGLAGQPVIDKTGLKGYYTLRMEVSRGRPAGGDSTAIGIDDPPDIFTALPAQLGLKLEPSKTTVSVLIVDNIERPTEN